MLKRSALVLLHIVLVPCLFAQALPNGSVVVLRAPSGRYLSATPGEGLALSPNTAAWEQWTYTASLDIYGGPALVSVFGGTLMLEGPSFRHAPAYAPDSRLGLLGLAPYTVNGTQLLQSYVLTNGGLAVIRQPSNNLCAVESGDQLTTTACNLNSITPAQAWRVDVVSNPAPRTALQKSAENRFATPVSPWGTYLYPERSGPLPQPVIHKAKTEALLPWVEHSNAADKILRFGDTVWIHFAFGTHAPNGSYIWALCQLNPNVHVHFAVIGDPGRSLSISDPTGTYKNGNRIPLGAKVCLQQKAANYYLSADPGNPRVRMAPHCAGWEWWTLQYTTPDNQGIVFRQ